MIRVLICDDHFIVRQGLRQILADAPDMDVAAEASSGAQAIQIARQLAASAPLDLVLLDIAMPQRDGLDVLKQFGKEFPALPVLVLSTYPDNQYLSLYTHLTLPTNREV